VSGAFEGQHTHNMSIWEYGRMNQDSRNTVSSTPRLKNKNKIKKPQMSLSNPE
jgi:hypothetical protein